MSVLPSKLNQAIAALKIEPEEITHISITWSASARHATFAISNSEIARMEPGFIWVEVDDDGAKVIETL